MPKSSQIRGMLLEEALLYLLRVSGYKIVDQIDPSDKTLLRSGAGIQVRGRGCNHQIDAIADFSITPPFTYPQRLLVEAKSLGSKVEIDVVRNALGVHRDVQEYWIPTNSSVPSRKRFHYQYAIISTSGYSSEAEKFAYAHDIYLIPAARTRYSQSFQNLQLTKEAIQLVGNFIESCHEVNQGIIALLDRRFPLLLIPNPTLSIGKFSQDQINVRIFWDETSWYITSDQDNRELFTFDMPEEMLKLYLKGGVLTKRRALDLKSELLREIQFTLVVDGRIRVVTLRLDMEWIEQLKEKLL